MVPSLNYNTVPGSTENISLNPPLVAKNKSDRGFFHEQLALFVSDAEHPWDTLTEVERARLQTPGHNLSVTTIRAYLYDGYRADRNDLTKGLYRSPLMQHVMIICHMRVDSIEKLSSSNVPVSQLTHQALAFWGTHLLSGLLSDTRVDMGYDYAGYYRAQIRFFEQEYNRKFTADLIAFYTRILYPTKTVSGGLDMIDEDSTMGRIIRQQRAAQQAQNPARTPSPNALTVPPQSNPPSIAAPASSPSIPSTSEHPSTINIRSDTPIMPSASTPISSEPSSPPPAPTPSSPAPRTSPLAKKPPPPRPRATRPPTAAAANAIPRQTRHGKRAADTDSEVLTDVTNKKQKTTVGNTAATAKSTANGNGKNKRKQGKKTVAAEEEPEAISSGLSDLSAEE
ncbi:hypothetical protein SISSUDRAFT_1067976 [Sistotremastrum suecicum HHB10207 ss-3]|uniref:Uncharacterized protein n=1 Tax=Sistotremastrum suecicum HHB10207 ss-3 TaxID=1314776 RepID=A0A165WIR5_9AGAM|nr:hypothetical protein SISSUDRAFT_1067976 [Sistotremastrum suecicum HHB10207 ss-3]